MTADQIRHDTTRELGRLVSVIENAIPRLQNVHLLLARELELSLPSARAALARATGVSVEAMVSFLHDKASDECSADEAYCFREIANRLENFKLDLGEIRSHLACAQVQRLASDDKIIAEHIDAALVLAEAALKGA